MKIKKQIFILLLIIPFFSFSQDIIYTYAGEEVKSKVVEITDNSIKYHKFEFIDGPIYSMPKSKVYMIIYKSGKNEKFLNNTPVAKAEKTDEEEVEEQKPLQRAKKPKLKVEEEPAEEVEEATEVEETAEKVLATDKTLLPKAVEVAKEKAVEDTTTKPAEEVKAVVPKAEEVKAEEVKEGAAKEPSESTEEKSTEP